MKAEGAKSTAADGATEVHTLAGVGLVVSAASFNRVIAERDALKAENALLEEVNAQLREQNDAVGEACAKYEAELGRIKALEPVAWRSRVKGVLSWWVELKEPPKRPQQETQPLYALGSKTYD